MRLLSVAENKIIEQINSLKDLVNLIYYKKEVGVDKKLNNCLKIVGIFIVSMFTAQKALKKTRIKLYNTLALPSLLYRSENWTIKARDARRITAAEMKCMRRAAGYTWADYKAISGCKGTKYNPSFGQNTGIQEKLFATCE